MIDPIINKLWGKSVLIKKQMQPARVQMLNLTSNETLAHIKCKKIL